MSLSKSQYSLTVVGERRQSFSERICDDLSEVILKYLSFDDKLRLRCVSRQFKRTVLQRHHCLSDFDHFLEESERMKKLENIFKMIPSLTSIRYSPELREVDPEAVDKFVDLLQEYYPQNERQLLPYILHLITISLPLNEKILRLYERFDE